MASTSHRRRAPDTASGRGGGRIIARLAHAVRLITLAALAATLLPLLAPAAPTAAAGCGTNWDSKRHPPATIRVYRTNTGNVDVVDFRTYVGTVMASGEFPSYLPKAVLQVGATAVKQYAWYYALRGHHRDSYRTRQGVCYDVRDDTNDQLYRPDRGANASSKQREAIADTWGLTLRKSGRFFITGYRAGAKVRCASDANGWKIYTWSAVDCADKGWDRQRILQAYLSPHLDFIWHAVGPGPDVAPKVSKPILTLKAGAQLGGATALVTWRGTPGTDAIAAYQLQHRTDDGRWRNVTLRDAAATSASLSLAPGHRHRFRVRARDSAGRAGAFVAGSAVRVRLTQAGWAHLVGPWSIAHDKQASGGLTRFTRSVGASASLTFTGRALAIVAPRGPEQGRARIFVNGVRYADLDLHAATERARSVVWVRDWAKAVKRTVRIQLLDSAGHDRVDVDAFLILR